MKMRYLLVVASLVVGLSMCNVSAVCQYNPMGWPILKVYKDANASAYFYTTSQCIVIYNLDQPFTKRLELLLDNAFLYGKKITYINNGAMSQPADMYWYDANDQQNLLTQQFPIYSNDTKAYIRIK